MTSYLFLRFAQYRAFWNARRTIGKVGFLLTSRLYRANQSLKDAGKFGLFLVGIVRVTAKPWFLAIVVAAVLQLSNPCLCRFFGKHGLSVPDDSDYVTFLAAISSIGGVFIGLYYAAIATVGSAMYAKVPSNLRDLLAQDRFGIVYMRFLSFLTYLCLVLICLRLSHLDRIYIAPPLITLAAGVGVFAFVKLGQRVFHLFDPTEFSSHIFEQLERRMAAVTVAKLRWRDESFQHHAYKQAEKAVTVLETLRDLLLQEQHLTGTPLLEVSKRTTRFLILYRTKKALVPTGSRWYPQIYRHAEWYRTDDMRLSIATETGTTIEPQTEVNRDWIEERLVSVLLDCLAVNVRNAQWENALAALQYIESYATTLAAHGRADSAFALFDQACSRTTAAIKQSSELAQAETVQKVAVAESLAAIPIALSIALRQRYASFRRADIVARIGTIDWSNPSTYYRAGFEDYVLSQIEYLAPRLAFERAVEGKEVSPTWYLAELATQPEAKQFVENIAVLTDKLPHAYAKLRETFSAAELRWMTAATLSRQWEYWHKLSEQVTVWESAWSEMSDDRKMKELPWAKFDAESTRTALGPMKITLLKAMSGLQTRLSALERPPTYPDYAGQFLHFSGEAVLEALIGEDADLLQDIFTRYFVGCLTQFAKMQSNDGPGWLVTQNLRIASAAVLDLMDVSGYALLLSELYENKTLWTIVRSAWDRYLADSGKTAAIVALVNFVESSLGAKPRDILRTGWQRRVEKKLAQLPHKPVAGDAWYLANETEVVHPSRLVQAMASRINSLDYDGIDIFVALYLGGKAGSENLREHWKRSGLSDKLDDEQYNSDIPSHEGEEK
ncbi:hypothetical protein OKW45_005373 [Paraburkholderia sp. WSM4175]|uniref:hypothetical protein n=1 Tax=Paraburkholderia sp. WSM4175 TaxID=2991072 RepID=UPI003D210A7E